MRQAYRACPVPRVRVRVRPPFAFSPDRATSTLLSAERRNFAGIIIKYVTLRPRPLCTCVPDSK